MIIIIENVLQIQKKIILFAKCANIKQNYSLKELIFLIIIH